MGSVKINPILVNQDVANFSSDDPVLSCDEATEAVVVTNAFDSTQYLYIGWNSKAGPGFSIPPGTSQVFERVGADLGGNTLYLNFANAAGGKAIVLEYKSNC